MDEEHFVATLQATYFGDKNAFNLCLKEYRNLKQALNEIKEIVKGYKTSSYYTSLAIDGVEKIIDKVLGEEQC